MVTLTLHVDEQLLKQLEAEAQDKQLSVEEVAIAKLGAKDTAPAETTEIQDFATALADMAEQLDLRSGRSDVSENFDAIISDLLDKDLRLPRENTDGENTGTP